MGSGLEVLLELLLDASGVGLEDFTVLDDLPCLSVGRVGLVQEESESDGGEGEVGNGDLVANDVLLGGVGGDTLLNGIEPVGEELG